MYDHEAEEIQGLRPQDELERTAEIMGGLREKHKSDLENLQLEVAKPQ